LLYGTALCPAEATRLARSIVGEAWITHSRTRRVFVAQKVEVVEVVEK